MVKETLETLIEKKSPLFQDKEIVSFLGEVESGKTVVSALLYYHLSKNWIPSSKGRWEAVPVSGDETINEIIRNMKQGSFTDPTPKNEYPRLITDIYNMEGKPSKTRLRLHDMSGETYASSLSKEYISEKERLTEILSGDGAYIAYASQYVIMVDCDLREDWDTDICKIVKMISSIKEIKRQIHNLNSNEKIHVPIAVVFTKSDRLPDNERDLPPEKLLEKYPSLKSSLTINHDHAMLSCFKVHVESKEEKKHEAELRVKKLEEELQSEFNQKKELERNQIDAAIEQAVSTAEKHARGQGYNKEDVKTAGNIAKQKILQQNQNQKPPQLPNRTEKLKPTWKISLPLSYSESEYNKLISWILTAKHDV